MRVCQKRALRTNNDWDDRRSLCALGSGDILMRRQQFIYSIVVAAVAAPRSKWMLDARRNEEKIQKRTA